MELNKQTGCLGGDIKIPLISFELLAEGSSFFYVNNMYFLCMSDVLLINDYGNCVKVTFC